MSWVYFLSNLGMGAGGTITPTGPPTLREAVRARLAETTALASLVGSRISFNALPQKKDAGPTFPAVTFYVASRSYDRNLGGPNGVSTATVRISCWSKSELEAAAMAQIVRSRFDGFSGWMGAVDVMGAFLEDESDLPEYPRQGTDSYTYQVVLTFNIIHRVTIPAYV